MQQNKVAFFTGLLLLIIHLSFMTLYQFRGSIENESVNKIIEFYITPQFTNDFTVFAPDPPLGREFFVYRGEDSKGDWTPWYEDATSLLQKAHSNPFSADYKRWKIQNILGFDLFSSYSYLLENDDFPNNFIKLLPIYKKGNKYAIKRVQDRNPEMKFESVQIAYIMQYVDSNKNPSIYKVPIYSVN